MGTRTNRNRAMRRIAAVILAGLIVISGAAFGSPRSIARASELYATSVPLESLPIAGNSEGVSVISPGNAGHYRGDAITHGLQLNIAGYTHAEFHLHQQYEELTGTVYADDGDGGSTPSFDIYDSSDPAHKQVLYTVTLGAEHKASFKVPVHGVDFIMLAMDNPGELDVVATLSSGISSNGTSPTPKPAQIRIRYPTANADVPANSKVIFAWQPFAGAANYAFLICVVGLSGAATIIPSTPLTFATTIHHKASFTWDDHGFLPGTYYYSVLPLDNSGHNLAGWSSPVQITVTS